MQPDKMVPSGHRGRGGLWLISDRGLRPPAGLACNTRLYWLPGLISSHQVGVSLWADSLTWMNCCCCTRQVTSLTHAGPFLGAIFLSLPLLVLMSGRPCQPWQAAQRPAPQAVPLCLRLLALVALLNWVAFESTKGKMVPFRKGRLRLPCWRVSRLVYFRHTGISILVVVTVLTLASWALWDGVLPSWGLSWLLNRLERGG